MKKIKAFLKKYVMVFLYLFLTTIEIISCNYSPTPREDAFMAGMWFTVGFLSFIYIKFMKPTIIHYKDAHALNVDIINRQEQIMKTMLEDMKGMALVLADLRKQTEETIKKIK